ncbi:potassium-transporting ATPase B chain [Bordetella bronchiseptica Bbr77]|nr:potassium-transporting ATPase B chain [Bordetella bronchiseptica Bbr77]
MANSPTPLSAQAGLPAASPSLPAATPHGAFGLWSRALAGPALRDTLRKLSPAAQLRNPVMFVVYAGSILTTLLWLLALAGLAEAPAGFILAVAAGLWFTVLFANFAEALAEGRGRQQAAALRGLRTTIEARVLTGFRDSDAAAALPPYWRSRATSRPSGALRRDDVVLIEAGETVPGDGQVIAGIASVDESAITGESAPVIRAAGSDFCSVTGGTRVLTTIGGLLSAIGVAGMSRMMQANVIATSGRAIEAAGDVSVLLLDKTGTITFGNRQAAAFVPAPGVSPAVLAEAARLASLADETPEGRSIVALAERILDTRSEAPAGARFVPFSAQSRMSGVDLDGRLIRKGAADALARWLGEGQGGLPAAVARDVDDVARRGSTPLVVAEGGQALGVIELKDIVKPGIQPRFAALRRMGIKTVMITGDNALTAAAIAAEAGVDDFLAEATPQAKLELIRACQADGHLVAMTGDGTNDAPALAQADVAVAMNSGTQAAKEAGNMVDLDSNPTKLIEIVEIGKQMLMTRGALTTFSVANDVAKYFAIIPAAFMAVYPQLAQLNVMGLATPASAILSAVIFNALIIVALIPLALKGVRYRPLGAAVLLRRNLLVYGLGGLLAPFAGIKLIDMALAALGWT